MTAFVDTSVLIRYLTGDPPHLLDAARRIMDGEERLMLTDVVLAETAFVLLSFYKVPRQAVVDSLVHLLGKRNIGVYGMGKDSAVRALLLCRPSGRVSFPDALLWATARSAAKGSRPTLVYSFDERFPSEGLELRADRETGKPMGDQ